MSGPFTDEEYGKDTAELRSVGSSLEPATMDLGTDRTPTSRFFVCSIEPAPRVSLDSWSLTIDGDAAERPVEVSWADLDRLPRHSVDAWLECAGNGRAMYHLSAGFEGSEALTDTKWILGAMGMATWRGPRLRDVLALAGIAGDAEWIGPVGLDTPNSEGDTVRMSLPITKAVDDDTIVATQMNGEALLPAHGAPARVVVPGWVGAYSVKWLDRIEISTSWVHSFRSDEYYRRRLADGTDLGPITTHPVKSTLALPWPASLAAGDLTISGYSRCGSSAVERLEVSIDDGPWFDVAIAAPVSRWAWQPFSFGWKAAAGDHQIRTRATDAGGNTQPETQAWHPNTVLWNAVTRHPIHIT